MKASISADSFPGRTFPGWVGFISSVAEFTPKAVQTEELRSSLVYEIRVFVQDPAGRNAPRHAGDRVPGIGSARPEPAIGKVAEQMSWTKILRGMAAAGIAGVGGCTVGPDYHPSAAHAPAAWSLAGGERADRIARRSLDLVDLV